MSLCYKNENGEIVKVADSGGGVSTADQITYDNTKSEVESTNVQDAIDGILGNMTDSIKTHSCVHGGNYDDFVESGRYENFGDWYKSTTNAPDGKNDDNNFYVDVFKRDDLYVKQIAYSVRVPYENYSRVKTDGVWRSWEKLPDKYDINAKVDTNRKIADITLENDIEAIDLSEKIIPTFETREELESFEAEHGAFPVGTKIVITSEQGEGGGVSSVDKVSYDNSESGLEATNVQDAVDELAENKADKTEVYTKTQTDTAIINKVAEIVAGAPEDFDTLKEMSDWISTHEQSASAMNTAIQSKITVPQTAEVGQILVVKAVDASGKPTEWECVPNVKYQLDGTTLTISTIGGD